MRSGAASLRDQPRHPAAEGGRLAGAGPGQDQQPLAGVGGRRALLGVERLQPAMLRFVVEHVFAKLGHRSG